MTLTKEELELMYVTNGMTGKEIGELIGKSASQVLRIMKKLGISARNAGYRSGPNHPNFGKKVKSYGKRHWFTCPDGSIVSMRSTWEYAYALYLNSNSVKWLYEPKTFNLKSGEAYTPDFYLVDSNSWVEVKGWMTATHKRKIHDWSEENPNETLIIANRQYLTSIGIDLKQVHRTRKPKFECLYCKSMFYRNYPDQKLCSVGCRNRFIANGGKLAKKIVNKRKYRGDQKGEMNSGSKLTYKDVEEIRTMRSQGIKVKDIAMSKNISASNIYNILKRKSWGGNYEIRNPCG